MPSAPASKRVTFDRCRPKSLAATRVSLGTDRAKVHVTAIWPEKRGKGRGLPGPIWTGFPAFSSLGDCRRETDNAVTRRSASALWADIAHMDIQNVDASPHPFPLYAKPTCTRNRTAPRRLCGFQRAGH